MSGKRPERRELMLRELSPSFNGGLETLCSESSDGPFAESKVEEKAEVGQDRREQNPGKGRSRWMTRQHDADNDAENDEKLQERSQDAPKREAFWYCHKNNPTRMSMILME